ncbi:MAG: hypothetical protein KDD40_07825, partial [Bdellovibrionales bacterium]|nr:hypothetical protein [Bdellovibrionales bacterium]
MAINIFKLYTLVLLMGCSLNTKIDTAKESSLVDPFEIAIDSTISSITASSASISGVCPENVDSVTVSVNSGSPQIFNCVNKTFNGQLDLSSEPDGALELTVSAQDSAGEVYSYDLSISKDTIGPTVSAVSSQSANAVYGIGDTVLVTVTFNEAVT